MRAESNGGSVPHVYGSANTTNALTERENGSEATSSPVAGSTGMDSGSRSVRRFAYADPPYPGQAKRHYGKKGDPFEGEVAEVDHAELIATLERDFPDGWALSTSVPALPELLALCPPTEPSKKRTWNGRGGVKLGTGVRVCAWFRSAGSPFPPSRVMWTWEPVIVRMPHWKQRHRHDFIRDTCVASQPHGFLGNTITGQKPEAFCFWIFDLLGATHEDELVDLFPGSGAVTAAWEKWRSQATIYDERPDVWVGIDQLWEQVV